MVLSGHATPEPPLVTAAFPLVRLWAVLRQRERSSPTLPTPTFFALSSRLLDLCRCRHVSRLRAGAQVPANGNHPQVKPTRQLAVLAGGASGSVDLRAASGAGQQRGSSVRRARPCRRPWLSPALELRSWLSARRRLQSGRSRIDRDRTSLRPGADRGTCDSGTGDSSAAEPSSGHRRFVFQTCSKRAAESPWNRMTEPFLA
jgi:hypothetical protein